MPCLIIKRGKKRYRAGVMINGEQYQKMFPDASRQSYREAMIWEDETRKELEILSIDTESLTLLDWCNEYLDYANERFVTKTYKEKKDAFKKLFSVFAQNNSVETLSPPDCMSFLRSIAKKRSGHSANKIRKNLAAAWEFGRRYLNGFPQEKNNPFRAVDKFPETRCPRYVPPEENFWKVYAIAEGQDKIMLFTFLHLAARRNEIFNLKWEDVDFVHNQVRLWTRKRMGGNQESDWLPMTSELRMVLRKWWEERPIKKTPYVFVCLNEHPGVADCYGNPYVVRKNFLKRLCVRAGVTPFGFHGIRHLTASILYHNGKDVSLIQAVLRHKNPTTTNRYLQSLGLEFVRKGLEEGLRESAQIIPFKPQSISNAANQ